MNEQSNQESTLYKDKNTSFVESSENQLLDKQIDSSDENLSHAPITRYLTELRARIISCLITLTFSSGICYFFLDDIAHYLMKPAGRLYYMQPTEAFFTYFKIAIFAGFLLALPIFFYHLWKFISPILIKGKNTFMCIFLFSSLFLFYLGLAFSFFFVLPVGLQFFLGFGNPQLEAVISIGRYFNFVIAFILPFGFIFELPLVIVILAKANMVSSEFLRKKRRIVIFMSFVIGAVVSPTPDIFSQSMIAIPILLLYEISHLIVKLGLHK